LGNIEILIQRYPLAHDDFVCFSYLKAEILKDMEKTDEAIESYKIVKNMSHQYRMTEYRLRKLRRF
jgi:hypothetical protein